jgi:hypothetical protein
MLSLLSFSLAAFKSILVRRSIKLFFYFGHVPISSADAEFRVAVSPVMIAWPAVLIGPR